MLLNRSPTDEEVDAEVAKEQKRLSEEKRKGPADYGRAIEEVRSRVGDLEGSFSSLREHVTASTKRVEDMLKEALEKWGQRKELLCMRTWSLLPPQRWLEHQA